MDEQLPESGEDTNSVEKTIIENENQEEKTKGLSKALGSLSSRQREAIHLKFNSEMTYEEISEILDISVESARTLIYRSIKELRKNIS